MTNLLEQAINSNDADHAARLIQKPPSETMPEDVRQAFCDAVRLFDRWRFDTPTPTLPFRTWGVSHSVGCVTLLLLTRTSHCL